MDRVSFEDELREFDDDYYVVSEGDCFMVYRNTDRGSDYVGMISQCDLEVYTIDDVFRYLGIY